ncbi:MAG TPA: MBL fold metallo-hydrolase [Treponemataceae bacterium]|nr:MBL fold metallo-hydrolase [Treponemataceae bacterium]
MKEAANVKITILADNAATPPYRAEHGFSALVETQRDDGGSDAVLFDVGMGALFGNAALAGVDLSRVSEVVLSHGHYDHTDALGAFLEKYPAARVHASTEVFRDHYSLRTGMCRKIALSDGNRVMLSALPEERFLTFGKAASIFDGRIHLAGRIPRVSPLESPSPLLFENSGCTIPDEVNDEIVLWTNTGYGLVILTGCCHAGFINTCEYVRAVSGIDDIHAVIGGFHLANVGEERLCATAEYIESREIPCVIPCHCTGDAEIEWLRARLGSDIVTKGECGCSFTFSVTQKGDT